MNKQARSLHPILAAFCPVVDCIADLLGPACEVVLHDITRPEKSIIKIRNGHVTGRKVGDPLTDLGLKMIKAVEKGLELTGNYNPRTRSGRLLKSNAIAIKDAKGVLIGILCFNLDVTRLQAAQSALKKISTEIGEFVLAEGALKVGGTKEEHFEKDLMPRLKGIIEEAAKRTGKNPSLLTPQERQDAILALEDRGVFYIKTSVPAVADLLGISIPSVYRYLGAARRSRTRSKKRAAS